MYVYNVNVSADKVSRNGNVVTLVAKATAATPNCSQQNPNWF